MQDKCDRDAIRFSNPGGQAPLVGIGLTELPNSRWAKAQPAHPLAASLRRQLPTQILEDLEAKSKPSNNRQLLIIHPEFKWVQNLQYYIQVTWRTYLIFTHVILYPPSNE